MILCFFHLVMPTIKWKINISGTQTLDPQVFQPCPSFLHIASSILHLSNEVKKSWFIHRQIFICIFNYEYFWNEGDIEMIFFSSYRHSNCTAQDSYIVETFLQSYARLISECCFSVTSMFGTFKSGMRAKICHQRVLSKAKGERKEE